MDQSGKLRYWSRRYTNKTVKFLGQSTVLGYWEYCIIGLAVRVNAQLIIWIAICAFVFLLHLLTGHTWLLQLGVVTVITTALPLATRAIIDTVQRNRERPQGHRPGFILVFLLWMLMVMSLLHLFGDMDSIAAEMDGPFSLLLPILENFWLTFAILSFLYMLSVISETYKFSKSTRPDYSKLVGAKGVVTKWQENSGTVRLDIHEKRGHWLLPMATKKNWRAQASQRLKPGNFVVVSSAGDKLGTVVVEIDNTQTLNIGGFGKVDSFFPKWWQWVLIGTLLLSSYIVGYNFGYDSYLFQTLTYSSGLAAISMPAWYLMCHFSDSSFPAAKQFAFWLMFTLGLMISSGIIHFLLEL